VDVPARIRSVLEDPDKEQLAVVWVGEARDTIISDSVFLQIKHAVIWH
jgi:hypothetical protein